MLIEARTRAAQDSIQNLPQFLVTWGKSIKFFEPPQEQLQPSKIFFVIRKLHNQICRRNFPFKPSKVIFVQKLWGTSVDSSTLSFLPSRVRVPSTPSTLLTFVVNYALYLSLHCEKYENKQKEAEFGTFFFKKTLNYFRLSNNIKRFYK